MEKRGVTNQGVHAR